MPTASTPPEATGYLTCLDQSGSPLAGVLFIITQLGMADAATGTSFSNTPVSVQSDSTGLVQANHVCGAPYTIQRGQYGSPVKYIAGNSTFQLPDCIG